MREEEVFGASYRAMQRLGDGQRKMGEIAAEEGVKAGALGKRLG